MSKSLRYISISHRTASVTQREEFHISEEAKSELVVLISDAFPDISGVLLLVTCNRTEIYFESEVICTNTLLDFIIDYALSIE